ncbi:hypothetical protein [Clavibacter tessellarius]|uniref:hypothetical protein n=1 Tax=Clavibacter tessellarius TaxID=31965 RepID=UPI001054AFE0|nr:hypothetical protein [Clavibacter michiganensis]
MNEYISNTHHASRHTGEYVTRTLHPVTITDLRASRILDSRGYPTVRVHLTLTDGTTVTGDARREHRPVHTKPSSSATAATPTLAATSPRPCS